MVDVVDPIPFPAEISWFAEHGSWQEAPAPNVVNFPVEVGPAKKRRRTYLPSTSLQFHRIISTEDLAIFLDFFNDDLKTGVYNFSAIDPRTEELTEYEFIQVPEWRDVSPGYWRLQFSLRRVNLSPAYGISVEQES